MPTQRTRAENRIIYHTPEGKTFAAYSANAGEANDDRMTERLESMVHTGKATGGHLEAYINGIGWVVAE